MSSPRVQLVLRSADINPTIQSYVGNAPAEPTGDYTDPTTGSFINRLRTRMVFNNVNLRSVLGSIYDYPARYNLKLESITFHLTSNLSTFTNLEQERCWNIFLTGFPFLKGWNNGSVTNEVLLASVRVPSGALAYTFQFNNSNEYTFEILENQYNNFRPIEIQLRDQLTNTLEPNTTLAVAVPNSQYVFSIYKI
jgi:hypothetical protein